MNRVVWSTKTAVVLPLAMALAAAQASGCKKSPELTDTTGEQSAPLKDPLEPAPNEAWAETELPPLEAPVLPADEAAPAPAERPPTAAEEEHSEDSPVLSEQPAEPESD